MSVGNTHPQPVTAERTRLALSATYASSRPFARRLANQSVRCSEMAFLRCFSNGSRMPTFSFSTFLMMSASIRLAAALLAESGTTRTAPPASRYLPYHLAAGLRYFWRSLVSG
jgi:hypothetical protein